MLTCQPHVIASRIHGFCWRKITLPFVFLLLEKKKIHRSLFGPPKLQTSIGIQKGHAGLTPFFHRCRGFERLKKATSHTPGVAGKDKHVGHLPLSTRFLFLSFRTKEPIWTQPHWSVPWDHQDEMPSPPSSPCPCKHDRPWGLWCIVMTTYGTLNDPPFRGFARQSSIFEELVSSVPGKHDLMDKIKPTSLRAIISPHHW